MKSYHKTLISLLKHIKAVIFDRTMTNKERYKVALEKLKSLDITGDEYLARKERLENDYISLQQATTATSIIDGMLQMFRLKVLGWNLKSVSKLYRGSDI